MPPLGIPLANSKFTLNSAGVAGFFGGKEAISAMATVHLYTGRRWLGWYNSPGSYTIAKRFGRMANSRFWDGLFPGPNDSPAISFALDGRPGPKYVGVLSGTTMQTGHLGYLTMERSKALKPVEIKGRTTTPVCVSYLAMKTVDYKSPVERLPLKDALFAIIPIACSVVACVFSALVYDWYSFSLILLGIISSGLTCYVIGTGKLVLKSVDKPAEGSPLGHGVLFGEHDVVVIKGSERDVNAITKGHFDLETDSQRGDKEKDPEQGDTEQDLQQGDKEKDSRQGDKEKDPEQGDKEKNSHQGDKEKDPEQGDKEKDPEQGDKEKDPERGDKEKDPEQGNKERDLEQGDKEKDSQQGDKEKDPVQGDKEKDPEQGDKEKDLEQGDKKKDSQQGDKEKDPEGDKQKDSQQRGKEEDPEQGDTEKGAVRSYHAIGCCSLLLIIQFLLQLLLIPQASLFGQIMFLSSLGVSWAYNSYLSSLEKEKTQADILFKKLSDPQMLRFRTGTRTTMAVFVCLLLFHEVDVPDTEKGSHCMQALRSCLPNDTHVWKLWFAKVVQQLVHLQGHKPKSYPYLNGDQTLSARDNYLLEGLLQDAKSAIDGYYDIFLPKLQNDRTDQLVNGH